MAWHDSSGKTTCEEKTKKHNNITTRVDNGCRTMWKVQNWVGMDAGDSWKHHNGHRKLQNNEGWKNFAWHPCTSLSKPLGIRRKTSMNSSLPNHQSCLCPHALGIFFIVVLQLKCFIVHNIPLWQPLNMGRTHMSWDILLFLGRACPWPRVNWFDVKQL